MDTPQEWIRTLVLVLDLVGTFVFALSGAAVGIRHQLDLFGVLVLSVVAASAGGITRDVLIGATPPAAIDDWRYLAVGTLAGLITFLSYPIRLGSSIDERLRRPILIVDAAGLSLFAVAGALKALAFQLGPMQAVLIGALTAVGVASSAMCSFPKFPPCCIPSCMRLLHSLAPRWSLRVARCNFHQKQRQSPVPRFASPSASSRYVGVGASQPPGGAPPIPPDAIPPDNPFTCVNENVHRPDTFWHVVRQPIRLTRTASMNEDHDMELTGIHHLTAISADIKENYRFYTQMLGMRLVKRSVNQDDVSAYHLFYADAKGSPGTDLTFFDWPAPRERRGTRSIVRTSLRVNGEATLRWWVKRFDASSVPHGDIVERDDRLTLQFEDPEGQRLALVDDSGAGDPPVSWDRSQVPAEYQVRGLGPIVISIPTLNPTDTLLTRVFNMRQVRDYPHPENPGSRVHVFEMGRGGPHTELHVAVQPDLPVARQGAGGVHHVAFRTPDANYDAWAERLNEFDVPNSGRVDRFWFRSLYVREPNGVLFEIATDGPGFAVDEDPETLGEKVVLPPFLEPHRAQILSNLKPID